MLRGRDSSTRPRAPWAQTGDLSAHYDSDHSADAGALHIVFQFVGKRQLGGSAKSLFMFIGLFQFHLPAHAGAANNTGGAVKVKSGSIFIQVLTQSTGGRCYPQLT